jgi:hypothetical protein
VLDDETGNVAVLAANAAAPIRNTRPPPTSGSRPRQRRGAGGLTSTDP